MAELNEICRLDYLYGTLATAYQGAITSLAAKDFCMIEEDSHVTFKGAIVSMPQGDYEARLMHEGKELARAGLRDGSFEFRVDKVFIMEAKNLQIDLVQKGRHIGTFLLKREKPDEFYSSAIELSADIKDLDARSLTAPLSAKPGLMKRAEDIISMILSSKKDWPRLSEAMNSFAKDLVWSDSRAFASWFKTLAGWSARACRSVPAEYSVRAASNLLSLIEIVLEHRSDIGDISTLTGTWLVLAIENEIDFSADPKKSANVIARINNDLPDADIRPVVRCFMDSLKKRLHKTPVLSKPFLDKLGAILTKDDLASLSRYSDRQKHEMLASLEEAEKLVAESEYARIFEYIRSAGSFLLDDTDMIDIAYSMLERTASKATAEILTGAACDLFHIFPTLSDAAFRNALAGTAHFIKKMIKLDMTDCLNSLLMEIENSAIEIKEYILLDPEVASAIISSDTKSSIRHYKSLLKQLYVPGPGISGFSGDTWSEIADPRHLARITKFMAVLCIQGIDGKNPDDILVHLLCNLYISGVFVPDDRLFQRNVSVYLNSPSFRKNFLFSYLLLKKLPVYFNEIGAAGMIRDDSTEIDSWANDNVLYFLRKQIHVNSSNYNIRLLEQTIKSWVYNDPGFLKDVLPADVFKTINLDLIARYCVVMQPLFRSMNMLDGEGLHLQRLLSASDSEIEKGFADITATDEIRRKIFLICRIYREIFRKYSFTGTDIPPSGPDPQLFNNLEHIIKLKEIILSPEKTEPHESLFYKRHIAFGIPSVLGTYHEAKFDALGELLRIENILVVRFEELITEVETAPAGFTDNDYRRWVGCLDSMYWLAKIHEMENFQIDEVLTILKTNSLRLSQIIDLLRIWQKELTWMVDSLTRQLHAPLAHVLGIFPKHALPEYLSNLDPAGSDFIEKASDILIRDILSSISGFTEMDRLIEALIKIFHSRIEEGPDICLSIADPASLKKAFFALDELHLMDAMRLAPTIGGKAKNLVYLLENELLVPNGVVFPSGKTFSLREYAEDESFMIDLKRAVQGIEERAGLSYGDSQKPFFLSVRSGAYISMPGILSSILYCGMNKTTCEAFAANTGDKLLAWDSYRRFIEHYAAIVLGVDENILAEVLAGFMKKNKVTTPDELTSSEMECVANHYLSELSRRDFKIPEDVFEQLKEAVKAVYKSWYGEKALQFRRAMEVSGHWGTAVLIMQMIPGNRKGSGASVFFTRTLPALESGIYGETREAATGDDLVYGKLINRPLAKAQASGALRSLEEVDPGLFAMHEGIAAEIEKAMGGLPQEVEATYVTDPDAGRMIYVLQTRRMEFHRGFIRHFDDICKMESNITGRGIGVHGGALSGIAAFSGNPERLAELKKSTGMPVILLRKSSSTQDVSLMADIDGIITSTGGATSHAAVLAQKFGITAVIGCSDMLIDADNNGEWYARIGSFLIKEGSAISIDGSTGLVYSGSCVFTTKKKE